MEAAGTSSASSVSETVWEGGEPRPITSNIAGDVQEPATRRRGRTPRYAMKQNAMLTTSRQPWPQSIQAGCQRAQPQVPRSVPSPQTVSTTCLTSLLLGPRPDHGCTLLAPSVPTSTARPFRPVLGMPAWYPPMPALPTVSFAQPPTFSPVAIGGDPPQPLSTSTSLPQPIPSSLTWGHTAAVTRPVHRVGAAPQVTQRPSLQLPPRCQARASAPPPDVRRGLQIMSRAPPCLESSSSCPELAPLRLDRVEQPSAYGLYQGPEPESVAERVVRFLRYGRENALAALRCSQDKESDGGVKGDASRGPGNRPRGIWSLRDVQEMQVEIIGKAGLDLLDTDGELQINPATHAPYKNLPKKYAVEARDLVETLLLDFHSGEPEIERAIDKASADLRKEGHFLSVEAVRQHTIKLLDRLLDHLDSLKKDCDRGLGDWIVRWSDADTIFVQERLDEFVEADDDGQVKYTHYSEFVAKYKQRLPTHTTAAYLRMVVKTLVQHDLPPEEWCRQVIKIKHNIDKAAGRDGSKLGEDWMDLTVESLVNVLRMFRFRHPLRRQDVELRLTLATVNPLAQHCGLSGASLDKIQDGTGPDQPGYRLKKRGYERVLALYEADPDNFEMTFALVKEMGNVQPVLFWDNVAKGEVKFQKFAAYGVTIGQYELRRYAIYFELTEAAAEKDIEAKMAKMRARALRGVHPESGEDSWLYGQNRRVTGSRSRAKGVQLDRAATIKEVKAVYAAQQESCSVTGQPIFLGRGGKKSGMCASMVLVGRSRTFQLMGCWVARGQGSCPRAAYKDFFEYWGVEGHRYMRFLRASPDGELVDCLEQTVMRILGVDEEGNRVREARFGEGKPDEVLNADGSGDTECVTSARRGDPEEATPVEQAQFGDGASTDSGAVKAAATTGESGATTAASSVVDSVPTVGESEAEDVAAIGRRGDNDAGTPVSPGSVRDTDGSGGGHLPAVDAKSTSPPQSLLLGSVDESWAAVRVPLMEKALKPGDEKYRRAGLSLLRHSPALADFDESALADTYKAPVLVEKDSVALRWTGKRARNRRQLLDRAPAQGTEAGTGYLLKVTFKKKKRLWAAASQDEQPDRASSDGSDAEADLSDAPPRAPAAVSTPATTKSRNAAKETGTPGRHRNLIRHYFGPRKPRQYASEAPAPPEPSEASTGGSVGGADTSRPEFAAQCRRTASSKGTRKTAKGASTTRPKTLLRPTFTRRVRNREETSGPSHHGEAHEPDDVTPAGTSSASLAAGSLGAVAAADDEAPASCLAPAAEQPTVGSGDHPAASLQGPKGAYSKRRARFISPLKS